ncbi:unnamed protein product [Chondrus crispus]|uniref:Uncharacterized protein n=1 Tax=Chondrus crispus TaxID=2769 RepID=R7Q6A3_CHOCR|nr:unnamed protein product [Chondrus crispus]XP_005712724.1 unnamed protein product [Chondrus crispus]CDF32920.1 unnamed protein product [Chondrus crispus]CDF32921.1 unnamed protein product [Chondrus crispus]|eukprot:XP_005712723.1 unnamed protein product [Chondrus crispus]
MCHFRVSSWKWVHESRFRVVVLVARACPLYIDERFYLTQLFSTVGGAIRPGAAVCATLALLF